MRRRAFVLKASRRFDRTLVSVHEAELYVIIDIMRARDRRDEVHIYTLILHKSVCRRSQTAVRNSCSIVSGDVSN